MLRKQFEYARDLGVPTIVCSPEPAALPLLEKLVKEFDIRLAIHNHGPEDKQFPSPNEVWDAVKDLDERIGLCIDVGHTARAGVDPARGDREVQVPPVRPPFQGRRRPESRPGQGRESRSAEAYWTSAACSRRCWKSNTPTTSASSTKATAEDPLPGIAESVGYTKASVAWVVA